MVSIAILALLSAALMGFAFGLGGRRDRLVDEGQRAEALARVVERLERAVAGAHGPVRTGGDWVEVVGRAVWPSVEAGKVGLPGELSARLGYEPGRRRLVWHEQGPQGEAMELVVPGVEAVAVDRFEEVVTATGSRPPVRVRVWLEAPGAGGRLVGEPAAAVDEGLGIEPGLVEGLGPPGGVGMSATGRAGEFRWSIDARAAGGRGAGGARAGGGALRWRAWSGDAGSRCWWCWW
ncbi:MAG: hypothetical protein KatS3mg103_0499 [Phycisphaerales bacterium]|nr:MAG: hypothetical protein KatS3mg103_0499 [Phycisphaerales bacterium]